MHITQFGGHYVWHLKKNQNLPPQRIRLPRMVIHLIIHIWPFRKKGIRFRDGLQQGSTLSPLFFNIYIDVVLRNCMERKRRGKKLIKFDARKDHYLCYDDDIAIVTRKERIQ